MTETLALIGASSAGVAGLVYLFRGARKAFQRFEALSKVIDRELTPNGGGSLHDKITRTKELLDEHLEVAQRDHDDLIVVKQRLGL